MSKAKELTIEVNAKLSIDRKTAETCLALVEMYVNANPVDIIGHRLPNGEHKFEFVSRHGGDY